MNRNLKQFAIVVHALQATQSLVILRCCFAEDAKIFTKIYNALAQCHCSVHQTFRLVTFLLPFPTWFSLTPLFKTSKLSEAREYVID